MTTPIHDFLERYAKSSTLRCHMPGHKGENPFDITEIFGADSLFEAEGIIAESEKNAAELFGSALTLYSCGGSTLSIQTMLFLAARNGKKRVVAGRFSHKSLISAAVLLGLEIDWIYPESFLSSKLYAVEIDAAIGLGTAAVFVNSIDYYGGECQLSEISEVCKRHAVPLLVDNAHGAYRVFLGKSPISLGASMSAESAHKTLPALTGAAYLHLTADYADGGREAMSLFGSSSPSYLMLESLDLCNRHILLEKNRALSAFAAVAELKKRLSEIGFSLLESDELRITINTRRSGYNGFSLAEKMRENGIECELSDDNFVVLLFSTVTDEAFVARVFEVMRKIPQNKPITERIIPVLRLDYALSPRKALFGRRIRVAVEKAVGRICAEIVAPCPPCVPIVMPGEIITKEVAQLLLSFGVSAIAVVE